MAVNVLVSPTLAGHEAGCTVVKHLRAVVKMTAEKCEESVQVLRAAAAGRSHRARHGRRARGGEPHGLSDHCEHRSKSGRVPERHGISVRNSRTLR